MRMKKWLLIGSLLTCSAAIAQNNTHQYLFVNLEKASDFSQSTVFGNGVAYYYLNIEKGADSSDALYRLLPFNEKRKAVNDKAGFYKGYGDTSLYVYNYFKTPTQAFNYLLAAGWEVVHTISEVESEMSLSTLQIKSVWSKTKFMLRKTTGNNGERPPQAQ